MVSILLGLANTAVRVRKAVVPMVMPHIKAFACSKCSSIASVSVSNNKITVRKCRCQ